MRRKTALQIARIRKEMHILVETFDLQAFPWCVRHRAIKNL